MTPKDLQNFSVSADELFSWIEQFNNRAVELYNRQQVEGLPLTDEEHVEYRQCVFIAGALSTYQDDLGAEDQSLDFGLKTTDDTAN